MGYFSNLRQETRTKALKEARELKRKGKSVTEIEKNRTNDPNSEAGESNTLKTAVDSHQVV